LLGVELLRTRDVRSTHKLVIEHIAKIRASCPALAHCMAVMCLESNLAYEAQHILHAMNEAKVPNWVALSEGQAGTLGWLTTVRAPPLLHSADTLPAHTRVRGAE
jgi:hypothetical protein